MESFSDLLSHAAKVGYQVFPCLLISSVVKQSNLFDRPSLATS